MQNPIFKRLFYPLAVLLGLWAGFRYALPLAAPFLLGLGVALAAEPVVRFATRRLSLGRGASAALAVTVTLVMLLTVLAIALAVLLRELGQLAGVLPNMEQAARSSMDSLESFLLKLARRAPEGLRGMLMRWILGFFGSSNHWAQSFAQHLPAIATSILGRIPNGALTLGTAIISSYMISARLPSLKAWLARIIPQSWKDKFLPTLKKVKSCLGSWLKAQAKLCGISFGIMTLGFWLLRISYAPLWALIIALVDALPILGSGTVLLPWALVRLLQGSSAHALGLSAIYIVVVTTRSVLEPKLLGKHLGLDPLVTLVALYAGFRLWGFFGMILAPILAVVSTELIKSQQ